MSEPDELVYSTSTRKTLDQLLDEDDADATIGTRWARAAKDIHGKTLLTGDIVTGPTPPKETGNDSRNDARDEQRGRHEDRLGQ